MFEGVKNLLGSASGVNQLSNKTVSVSHFGSISTSPSGNSNENKNKSKSKLDISIR